LSFAGDISQEKLGASPVVADGRKDGTDEVEVIGFLRYTINGQMISIGGSPGRINKTRCRVGTAVVDPNGQISGAQSCL
jgi:hypothetical protein